MVMFFFFPVAAVKKYEKLKTPLFLVWNLMLFKGQKYHQGSLACFIFAL